MTTTAIIVNAGILAGIICAVLVVRFVQKQRSTQVVQASGFQVPLTAVRN